MEDIEVPFFEVHYVTIQKVGSVPVAKGDFQALPRQVQAWLAQMVRFCEIFNPKSPIIFSRFNCAHQKVSLSATVRKKKQK